MITIQEIKELINQGKTGEAITTLTAYLDTAGSSHPKDELHYMLGNALRKQGDFAGAMNHYSEAIQLNPQSPAAEARKALLSIMEFYNKDMFNH